MKSVLPALILACCLSSACSRKPAPSPQPAPAPLPTAASLNRTPPPAAAPAPAPDIIAGSSALPIVLTRRTGDLDVMMRERHIRALVVINRMEFFYDKGHPRGIAYEALEEFQRLLNQRFKTGALKTTVTFVPVRNDQLEAALLQGLGDIVATGVFVTPERAQRLSFTVPWATNVNEVIISGPSAPALAGIDDLSGVEVFANPISVAYASLQQLNDSRQKSGRAPIRVRAADKNLSPEDLLEMVDAGLIPATVTGSRKAQLWSQVLPHITVHQDIVVHQDGELAWAVRKDSPQLKQALDDFLKDHGVGSSFGNTLLRRYLQNTKYVKDSTSKAELAKFRTMVDLFRKYGEEYDFDYLMLAAQGYQESLLDQRRRSKSGAVGIMQVIPKYAAAKPISVRDVSTADGNIRAGTKMLRHIRDTYFEDGAIDPLNKTLLSFASYNAGPSRIARLRKLAKDRGLDPNVWFGNVDLVVAKDIGQETVVYVSNIYKYYVAYKLALEASQPATSPDGPAAPN
ncbi:MAG: transporter substrate-binding domain-containing protein [Proteobacteria bacterium]|nr:transporter substrate-binding domain-containing protein [Pseudomonadota bacterium]